MFKKIVFLAVYAVACLVVMSYAMKPAPVSGEAEADPLPLPTAETDPERLTPRQYLYLIHPETAEDVDRIVRCESGWQAGAENPTSSASGLCQFLDSTWLSTARRSGLAELDLTQKTDPYVHLEMCVWLYDEDGIRHWLESAPCHGL